MIDLRTLHAMRGALSGNEKLSSTMREVARKQSGSPLASLFMGPPGGQKKKPSSVFDKLATAGHGPPQQYEEIDKARWMQTLKDVPIVVLGTGVGYGIGKTLSQYVLPHVFKTPEAQQTLKKYLPAATTAVGGLGSAMLAVQRHMLRERRDQAARKAREGKGPINQDATVAQTPPGSAPAAP